MATEASNNTTPTTNYEQLENTHRESAYGEQMGKRMVRKMAETQTSQYQHTDKPRTKTGDTTIPLLPIRGKKQKQHKNTYFINKRDYQTNTN